MFQPLDENRDFVDLVHPVEGCVFAQPLPVFRCSFGRFLTHIIRRLLIKEAGAAGEALPGDLQARFHARLPGVELHNLYGPTEAAVDVIYVEVERVKKSESGMIIDPITVNKNQSVQEVQEIMSMYKISGLPVLHEGKLVGIVTNRDLRFVKDTTAEIATVMNSPKIKSYVNHSQIVNILP